MPVRKFEVEIPDVGKRVVSADIPADATEDEIRSSLNDYVETAYQKAFHEQATATPGAPRAPLPRGLQQKKTFGSASEDVHVQGTPAGQLPAEQRLAELVKNPKAQARMNSRKPEPGAFTLQDAATLLPGPTWMRPLVGASVQTPADFGTAALLSGVAPATDALQVSNRGLNALLGAGKGVGLHELGIRAHAAMNGDAQPEFAKRSASDYGWQALSGALGASAGFATGQKPVDKRALALRSYEDWVGRKKDLQAQAQAAQAAQHKLQTEAAVEGTAREEARTALSDLTKGAKETLAKRQAEIQKQLAELDKNHTGSKQALADAETALNAHKSRLEGMQSKVREGGVEEINSKLNNVNDLLDKLKSKEHAGDAFLSLRPERVQKIQEIQEEIAKQEARRTINPKVANNKGWQTAIDKKVEQLRGQIAELADPDLNAKGIESERLRLQAVRRRLLTEQKRIKSGFSAPSVSDENDARTLADLQKNFEKLQSQVRGHELTRKELQERLVGLAAGTDPDLEHQRALLKASHKAASEAFKRKKLDALRQQEEVDKVRTALAEHAKSEPPTPKDPDVYEKLKGQLPRALAHVFAGGLGSQFNPIFHVSPLIGMGAGLATDALLRTEAGRKLIQLLSHQDAKTLLPLTVNASQQK